MREFDFLLRNRDAEFSHSSRLDWYQDKQQVQDVDYWKFIKRYNGGLFFNRSLIVYGFLYSQDPYSLNRINAKMEREYALISADSFFFACDIFGGQFCFDIVTGKIYYFNTDSGHKEFVAHNFIEWIRAIESKTDYYTGQSFIIKWEEVMSLLNYEERLTAKVPFVLGGEYKLANCRVDNLYKILEFNSSIAKQISNLPDGTEIKYRLD